MKYILLISLILITTTFSLDCNDRKQISKIYDASDKVTKWTELVDYVHKFKECDEGKVFDRNSAVVEQLFLDDWERLWKTRIFEKHPDVWDFVLKHINDTWVIGSNHWFFKLVNFQCPEKDEAICAVMKARVQDKATELYRDGESDMSNESASEPSGDDTEAEGSEPAESQGLDPDDTGEE